MDGRRTGESEQAHIARLNDEIERLRGIINDDRLEGAADEIERLREEVEHLHKMTVKWSVLQVESSQENQRLRETNKRLGEIATDAVEWLPPASVNGPREKYQNEIKELTDGHC